MNYVCQRPCFFDRLYKAGDVVTDERVYEALKPHFVPEGKSGVQIEAHEDKLEPTTFSEVATKEKPKLPEIPDVLGKPKATARKTSAAKK